MTEYGLLLEDISGNVQFPMDVFSEVAQPKVRKVTVYHSSDSFDPKTIEEDIEPVRFGFTGLLQADVVERERKLHYLLRTDNDIILIYFDRDVATYVSMSRGVPANDPAGSDFDIFSIECTAKGAVLGQVREAVDSRCTTDGEEITDTDAMRDKAIRLDSSLTVADWQQNAATGTAPTPANINDNDIETYANFNTPNQYCEIEFDTPFYVNKFRYIGHDSHNEDGDYKLQYFDIDTETWVDWKTEIPTRLGSWSDWTTITMVLTKKVRIVATTIDSLGANGGTEWELKDDASRNSIYFTQLQNDYMLPDGPYNMIARLRRSEDASANIVTMSVDVSGNPSATFDASENYLIYELPFTVDASANGYDLGATVTFTVTKEDVSGNITIDFLGYAAVQ